MMFLRVTCMVPTIITTITTIIMARKMERKKGKEEIIRRDENIAVNLLLLNIIVSVYFVKNSFGEFKVNLMLLGSR